MIKAYTIDKEGRIQIAPETLTQEQIKEIKEYNCTIDELIQANPGKEILLIERPTLQADKCTAILLS
jgi:hypothetical protein